MARDPGPRLRRRQRRLAARSELADGLVGLGDDPHPRVTAQGPGLEVEHLLRRWVPSSTPRTGSPAGGRPRPDRSRTGPAVRRRRPAASATMATASVELGRTSVSDPTTIFTQVVSAGREGHREEPSLAFGVTRLTVDARELHVHAHVGEPRRASGPARRPGSRWSRASPASRATATRRPARTTRRVWSSGSPPVRLTEWWGSWRPSVVDRLDHVPPSEGGWPPPASRVAPASVSIRHGPGRRSSASGWSQ